MVIEILICGIVLLIMYPLFNRFLFLINRPLREGMDVATGIPTEYQDYKNDPLILAKQNAGNIENLKERVDKLESYDISKIKQKMSDLNDQMIALTQNQSLTMGNVNAVATSTVAGDSTPTPTPTPFV